MTDKRDEQEIRAENQALRVAAKVMGIQVTPGPIFSTVGDRKFECVVTENQMLRAALGAQRNQGPESSTDQSLHTELATAKTEREFLRAENTKLVDCLASKLSKEGGDTDEKLTTTQRIFRAKGLPSNTKVDIKGPGFYS